MIENIGNRLSSMAQRVVPDPFIFAIALTLIAFALAWGITDSTAGQVIGAWGKGSWELLAFGMQMCLVLVTGHALATSRPVKRGITALSSLPKTGPGAAAMIALVACLCGLLNWGLGIIVGALLAREVAVRGESSGRKFHYPLLAAAGYSGLLIWHGGLSGSAPMLVATKGHFLESEIGIIRISQTLFSPLNIAMSVALLITIPALYALLHPKKEAAPPSDWNVGEGAEEKLPPPSSFAQKLERARPVSLMAGLMGTIFLVRQFATVGFKPDLNLVNLAFLSLGLLFHDNVRSYLNAVSEGAKACAGIILQFPFYAGIMGIMKYTGLMKLMAVALAGSVGPALYPVVTFFSAGLVNVFVPSGGGQWAVQGPVAVEVSQALGVPISKTIMAVAYGDQWTNMLQPFWALALLGITKLKAGDIMGYTVLAMLVTMPLFVLMLLLLPV